MSGHSLVFLSEQDKNALFFMNMKELKENCLNLGLSPKGKKTVLIERLIYLAQCGEKCEEIPYPEKSRAQKGKTYPLAPSLLMLKGNYKNDLKTRLFFKELIGAHFHFTAWGIDWLEVSWRAANPPTYAEFASYWQQTWQMRKKLKAEPKQEWAYLSFCQAFLEKHPGATRLELATAWKAQREIEVTKALEKIEQMRRALEIL
jgi:hypothetical protein